MLYPSALVNFEKLVELMNEGQESVTLEPKKTQHVYRIQFRPPKEGTVEDVYFVLEESEKFDADRDIFLANPKYKPE